MENCEITSAVPAAEPGGETAATAQETISPAPQESPISPEKTDAVPPEEEEDEQTGEPEVTDNPAGSDENEMSEPDPLDRILDELRTLTQEEKDRRERRCAEEGLEAIRRLDPDIRSADDLFTMEDGEVFYDLVVRRGLDWETAYRAARFPSLMERAASRGAQEERNRLSCREHLRRTVGKGVPQGSVPVEIMQIYRAMNPAVSESEIVRHYNKTKQ